jgi:hypothetical protein
MTAELLYGLPGISETIRVDKQEEALKQASRQAGLELQMH